MPDDPRVKIIIEGDASGAVAAGKISVTPLHMNLTERETLAKMRETLGQS